jgi:hypothetical protein
MPIYVKDGGTWREISSSAGTQLYVRDSTSFTNKTITNAYVKNSGSWETVFTLFDTPTSFSTATGSVAVPANANAIHFQFAVGGGGGGVGGAEYDKANGESAGAGGSSGGYISDKVFSVTGGETLTINAGTGGAGTSGGYNTTATSGGNTTVTGTSSSTLFTLTGGAGSSASGGGVQGPLRSNAVGAVGTATISGTVLTSGTTVDGLNITSFTSGPVGTFNQSGDGNVGTNPGNCSGDNCQITGGTGGSSYAGPGAVTGGTGAPAGGSGTVGTRGAGGGGGGAQPQSSGTAGGAGEVSYRFMRIA